MDPRYGAYVNLLTGPRSSRSGIRIKIRNRIRNRISFEMEISIRMMENGAVEQWSSRAVEQ